MKAKDTQQVLLPLQRRKAIAELIENEEVCNTEALAKRFSVSTMTIRRDLKSLEQMGYVQLTHGGAISRAAHLHDIPYSDKTTSNIKIKQRIAQAAADKVKNDTCIILDAGTSTLELAKLLYNKSLTVITTDLHIALILHTAPSITLYTLGGVIDKLSASSFDSTSYKALHGIRASQAFIGTNVWDVQSGVTCSSAAKQKIKQLMMKNSQESILLADSSKYGFFSPWHIAGVEDFHTIISDELLSNTQRGLLERAGAKLELIPAKT